MEITISIPMLILIIFGSSFFTLVIISLLTAGRNSTNDSAHIAVTNDSGK